MRRALNALKAVTLSLVGCLILEAGASEYPNRAIQIICPFPPGAIGDLTARLVGGKVSTMLGQPVVVMNRGGAGGVIGTYAMLNMPADGYTILQASPPVYSAPLLNKDVTYDPLKDLQIVNLSVTAPYYLVIKSDMPWKSTADLVTEAKKNPGRLSFGSSGPGGTLHFAGEMFKLDTGVDLLHVPMNGQAPALTAVLGGHVSMAFADLGGALGYLQAGSMRALVVLARERQRAMPDVPTSAERGIPNAIISTWQGFAVKAGTPPEIVSRLDGAIKEALKDKDVIAKFEKAGVSVANLGAKEGAQFVAQDQMLKAKVAQAANLLPR